MQIACPACQTRYTVPDGAIPPEGRTVRCAKCRHSWFENAATVDIGDAQNEPASVENSAVAAPVAPAVGDWDDAGGERTAAASPQPTFAHAADRPQPVSDAPGSDAPPAAQSGAEREATASTAAQAWRDEPGLAGGAGLAKPAPVPVPDRVAAFEPAFAERWEEPAPPKSRLRLVVFVLVVLLAVAAAAFAAVRFYGAPAWLPVGQVAFAPASDSLELDFPADKQDRRTLPNGLQFFAASGTVTNIGNSTEHVPDVQVVLRDAQERVVYTWELEPPKRDLAPGETVSINEAVTDVPASARVVEIGWKAG